MKKVPSKKEREDLYEREKNRTLLANERKYKN